MLQVESAYLQISVRWVEYNGQSPLAMGNDNAVKSGQGAHVINDILTMAFSGDELV